MSFPDIDIDFDEERRGEILDYMRKKYGEDCVAAIRTISTRKGKMAIKDATRNLKNDRPTHMSLQEWTALGDKLAASIPDDGKKTIKELMHGGGFVDVTSPEALRILENTAKLEGISRQAGQHACGYVVSSHSLETTMPLRRTAKNGYILTQWDKDEVEAVGYVKLDALGSLTLARIRKTEEKNQDCW